MSETSRKACRRLRKQRPAQPPIQERIRAAVGESGHAQYYDVLLKVFPPDLYPRAWRYSSNGGPPGCAMAFHNALRKMGGRRGYMDGEVWIP